jgi:hypothetical protein
VGGHTPNASRPIEQETSAPGGLVGANPTGQRLKGGAMKSMSAQGQKVGGYRKYERPGAEGGGYEEYGRQPPRQYSAPGYGGVESYGGYGGPPAYVVRVSRVMGRPVLVMGRPIQVMGKLVLVMGKVDLAMRRVARITGQGG